MTKYTGSGLTVAYNSGAWSANFVRSVEFTETCDVVESTGAGDASKTYLATIKDGTAIINMIDDSDNATVLDKFEPGTSSTLTVTKAGSETIVGTGLVTSRAVAVGYNELALVTINLQITGGVTHA